jgi:hypothetical protein
VIELEPPDQDWAPDFSPVVQTALDEALPVVAAEVRSIFGQ